MNKSTAQKAQACEQNETSTKLSPSIVVIKSTETQATLTIGTCHCSS